MPANQNAYNTRLTDEGLEKRFRDTFKSQSGAELIDDLYASGVIVPVVDFTAAAEGSQLPFVLSSAWDFSSGNTEINGSSNVTLINTPGFWKIDLVVTVSSNPSVESGQLELYDGATAKRVWRFRIGNTNQGSPITESETFYVFLRTGDILRGTSSGDTTISTVYRQVADANGNLTDPLGFTPQ